MADVSESFNFYDLYGYLFPGVALALFLLFPFACYQQIPASNFGLGSALAGTIGAYIAGHLLQTIAVRALPSKFPDTHRVLRFPSDSMLDGDDRTFTSKLKSDVAAEILKVFGIDVNDPSGQAANRNDAFFLCRDTLVAAKQATYVEQYQGMYSMMRGLSVALLFGSSYMAGWTAALAQGEDSMVVDRVVLAIGIALALGSSFRAHFRPHNYDPEFERKWGTRLLVGLMIALAATGYSCGATTGVGWSKVWSSASLAQSRSCCSFAATARMKFSRKNMPRRFSAAS